jgi:MFS family permease
MTSALGVGGVLGGLVMLRYRPHRPLVSATVGSIAALSFFVVLAAAAPLWAVVVAATGTGLGFEIFGVLWSSALQRYIPADRLSRVSAYDSLGSFAFMPIGLALAGPIANGLGGVHHALWAMLVVMIVPTLLVLGVPDIWRLGTTDELAAP